MEKIRVLLVDDHQLFRRGVRSNFLEEAEDIEVIGEADDGLMALDKARELDARREILMDINMPRCNGLEATKRINRKCLMSRFSR